MLAQHMLVELKEWDVKCSEKWSEWTLRMVSKVMVR